MTAQEKEKKRETKRMKFRILNEQWDEIYKYVESDGYVNAGKWEKRKRTDLKKDPT